MVEEWKSDDDEDYSYIENMEVGSAQSERAQMAKRRRNKTSDPSEALSPLMCSLILVAVVSIIHFTHTSAPHMIEQHPIAYHPTSSTGRVTKARESIQSAVPKDLPGLKSPDQPESEFQSNSSLEDDKDSDTPSTPTPVPLAALAPAEDPSACKAIQRELARPPHGPAPRDLQESLKRLLGSVGQIETGAAAVLHAEMEAIRAEAACWQGLGFHGSDLEDVWLYSNIFRFLGDSGTFVEYPAYRGANGSSIFFEQTLHWKGLCIEEKQENLLELQKTRPGCTNVLAAPTAQGKGTDDVDLAGLLGHNNISHVSLLSLHCSKCQSTILPSLLATDISIDAVLLAKPTSTNAMTQLQGLMLQHQFFLVNNEADWIFLHDRLVTQSDDDDA